MAICDVKQSKRRKICIGDLDRRLNIYKRNIHAPASDSEDQHFQEYVLLLTAWALIESSNALTTFDGISVTGIEAYKVFTRYDARLKSNDDLFIQFHGQNIEVVGVENWDARNEYLVLSCVLRGDATRLRAL